MQSTSPGEPNAQKVAFRIEETPEVPWLGLLFASAGMAPFAAGAIGVWIFGDGASALIARLTVIWGGAILAFLAGVRRGLSFRTPGGEDAAQIVTMLYLFVLALAALLVPWMLVALAALIIGYASIAVLDPIAAKHREAPLFFTRLRPAQMLVPVASLVAIVAYVATKG